MSKIIFGIDFGYSNITLIKNDEGIVLEEKNLAAFILDKNKEVLLCTGNDAKLLKKEGSVNAKFVSSFDSNGVFCEKYAIMILKDIFKKAYIKKSVIASSSIIVSFPCGFLDAEKAVLVELFKKIGFNKVYLVQKLICNALSCDESILNKPILIADIGGKTCEIGVVKNKNLVCGSTLFLGGDNIDASIKEFVKFKYLVQIDLEKSEKIKKEIGSMNENDVASMIVNAVHLNTNNHTKIAVLAADVLVATRDFCDEVINVIKATLKTISSDDVAEIKDNRVMLCGGSARLAGIEKYVEDKLKIHTFKNENFNFSCAVGLYHLANNENLLASCMEQI